jgi:hypothetical protein
MRATRRADKSGTVTTVPDLVSDGIGSLLTVNPFLIDFVGPTPISGEGEITKGKRP